MKTQKTRLLFITGLALAFIVFGGALSLRSQAARLAMTAADADRQSNSYASAAYGKLPINFEANRGQTDDRVKFVARGSGYTLFLTPDEAVIQLRTGDLSRRKKEPVQAWNRLESSSSASRNRLSAVLRANLVGAYANAQATGLDQLPGKSNYFIGNDPKRWRTDIPTYARVKFASVYPGVDVVYYGTQARQLEYDFIIAPQADPKAIRLGFTGAEKLEIDGQGELLMRLAGKQLRLEKPVVYQEKDSVRQVIDGRYTFNKSKQEVGFEIGAYDRTRALVIDPILAYSTFLGGTGEDTGVEIAVNPHGNAFVTGLTTSLNFPMAGNFGGGGSDAFVMKFNAEGNQVIYSTYLGGSDIENVYPSPEELGPTYGGIAINAKDEAYVTGLTRSENFPITPGAYQQSLKGLSDAFVTRLNAAGNMLVYSTFLGCNGVNAADGGQGVAVDGFDQAYVTGFDYSGGLPVNGFAMHSAGCDGYVAKLNAGGSAILYATYLGGDSCNLGWAIAVDANQDAFVSGETSSTNFPTTPGALDTTCGTDGTCNGPERKADFFITKVDTKLTGPASLSYSTYLGGSGEERVTYNGSIAVDSAGNLIYVTGLTASVNPADFPIKNGAQPLPNCTSSGCSAEAFITKLDVSTPLKLGLGQVVYSTYLGGPGTEIGTGIAADINGNAYVAGATGGTFPSSPGMFGCTDPGVFVAKLDPNGAIKYATCISGLGQDTGLDIAIDPAGCAYVTGFTESSNYPTVNAFQPLFAGGTGATPSDAFVTKLCSGLDHFNCYDVKSEPGFQSFDVELRDQFERRMVTVVKPLMLCNPAAKCVNGDCTQVLNPDDHLVCYETKDSRGTPSFERREVIVTNQFGQRQRLTVFSRANLLCVPSLKAHVNSSR
jgi:hypothetical protein